MPLPLLLIAVVGAASGAAAAKGTTKIREFLNEGKTIETQCSYCNVYGSHVFCEIDRSWVAGGATGIVSGAAGGTLIGIIAKKLYKCSHCGNLIYEDGSKRDWNADLAMSNAAKNFVMYPELGTAYKELSNMIERNKAIELNYKEELDKLKLEVSQKDIDANILKSKILSLIEKIKKDNTG